MTESQRLLAQYAKDSSDAAFQEIVARYVDLTYSTALRLVNGDAHQAQDVTQAVFIDLARMARTLSREVMLGGWLHRHTCFVAGKVMRGERRRAERERQAVEMNALREDPQRSWSEIAPVLDDAINQLGAHDRVAILLRFFEQRDFRSIGEVLGTSENTARMRVSRALDKLGSLLKRRGIACTTAALGTTLATGAVAAAPAGTAIAIVGAVGASAAAGTTGTLTLLNLMHLTKLQIGFTALVIAGVATTLVVQHQAQLKLREQNEALQARVTQLQTDYENLTARAAKVNRTRAPNLPAPALEAMSSTNASAEDLQSTNLYARLMNRQTPRLTAAQIEPYLAANGRNASSLLAAYRTTGDTALLAEAMHKYPTDSQVAFEALFRSDATPEERRQWLDALKNSDPNNALPAYLSALDHFKAGEADRGVQELVAAAAKSEFQDYSLERGQADEEAFMAAGHSVSEAKTLASLQLLLPQVRDLNRLSERLLDLSKSYRGSGDSASAQAVLQMTADLGRRYSGGSPGEALISQMVGLAIERNALNGMDGNSLYGDSGRTVQDRLSQISQQITSLKDLARQTDELGPRITDQDWIIYKDRWKQFGEEAAERWLIQKYGNNR